MSNKLEATYHDQTPPEMLWVDIETTGLVEDDCIPIELGLAVTTKTGAKIAQFSCMIWEPTLTWKIKLAEGASNKFVGPMHQESGLWDDIFRGRRDGTTFTRVEAERAAIDWLGEVNVRFGTLPMCGNSVGSLDRPVLLVHMPDLYHWFHYRQIDVSTLKELCKMHNPDLYAQMPEKTGNHRVLGDIDSSIDEYLFYLDNFLIQED